MTAARFYDDPDLPGWMRWELGDDGRFNALLGPVSVKAEGPGRAVVRMTPERRHSNLRDHVHGGALAGFADVALFAAARGLGVLQAGGSSTIDLSLQFVAGAEIGRPVDAEVELLRETGRMLFLRAVMRQGDTVVASFTGTVRKASLPQ